MVPFVERWIIIMIKKMLDELNCFLSKIPKKVQANAIIAKEKELGVSFPKGMKEFYEYYGDGRISEAGAYTLLCGSRWFP